MSEVNQQQSTMRYLSWGNKRFIGAPSSKAFAISLSVVCLSVGLLVCLSFFFSIELSVDVRGKVKRAFAPTKVRVTGGGQIQEVYVTGGEIVEKGSRLIKVVDDRVESTIVAPVSGVIGQIDAVVGERISDSLPQIQILKSDQSVFVETFVSPVEITKIKKGLPVYVAVDAFSKSKYGYFHGVVESADLIPQKGDRNISQVKDKYRVTILLNDSALQKIGDKQFFPGMEVDLKIVWKKDKTSTMISNFLLQKPN